MIGRGSTRMIRQGMQGNRQQEVAMVTAKQKAAARRNVRKAAKAARRKKTIAKLPKKTRTALGKQGAKVARQKRGK